VAFTFVMLILHTVGTPAIYAYLFFWKHYNALEALKEQELEDARIALLEEDKKYISSKAPVAVRAGEPTRPRINPEDVLPGYMLKLTGGYEYRTYWFEIFESVRKVLIVGVPATFADRGGIAQLFWGLLVCSGTFGSYMMYAPFIEDSDDKLSQLAQLQIFLTLVSSLSLRADTDGSGTVASLVTIVLFIVPVLGLALETPLLEVLGQGKAKLGELLSKAFPNLKPPYDPSLAGEDRTEAPSASNVTNVTLALPLAPVAASAPPPSGPPPSSASSCSFAPSASSSSASEPAGAQQLLA